MAEWEGHQHRELAVQLFNRAWDLMEKDNRTAEETDEMIHAAHASRYHWSQVGLPVNLCRGEWQISRMYSVLERGEPCLYHALRGLEIALNNDIGDWDLGFAFESVARAFAICGDIGAAREWYAKAKAQANHVAESENRELLLSDLETVPI